MTLNEQRMSAKVQSHVLPKKGRVLPKKKVMYPVPSSERMVVLVKAWVPSSWSKRIKEEANQKTMGNVSEFLRFAIYKQLK